MNKYFYPTKLTSVLTYFALISVSHASHSGTILVERPDMFYKKPYVLIKDSTDNFHDVIKPDLHDTQKTIRGFDYTEQVDKGYLTKEKRLQLLTNNNCLFIDELHGKKITFDLLQDEGVDIESVVPRQDKDKSSEPLNDSKDKKIENENLNDVHFNKESLMKKVINNRGSQGYMWNYIAGDNSEYIQQRLNEFLDKLIDKETPSSSSEDIHDNLPKIDHLFKKFTSISENIGVETTRDTSFPYLMDLFLFYELDKKKNLIFRHQGALNDQIDSLKFIAQEIIEERSYTRFGQYFRNTRQYEFSVACKNYLQSVLG